MTSGARSLAAFDRWVRATDLDALDLASQRIVPLLYRNLVRQQVSHACMPRLKGVHRYWWLRNSTGMKWLAENLAALRREGIDAPVLLKGAAVATAYYADLGSRPMNDLDLWVPSDRAPVALRCLLERGFRPTLHDVDAAHGDWSHRIVSAVHAVNLAGPDGRELDLHWRAFHEPWETPRADDTMWSRARPVQVFGASARVPAPPDLLLQIVAHGVRQNVLPAIWWIPDAVHILGREGAAFPWATFAEEANQRGLTLLARRALAYLRRHFDVDVEAGLQHLEQIPLSIDEVTRYWERTRARDPSLRFRSYRILKEYRAHARSAAVPMSPLGLVRFCQARWNVDAGALPAEVIRRLWRLLSGQEEVAMSAARSSP